MGKVPHGVVPVLQGADGLSIAALVRERATARNGFEVREQLVGVPIFEEESGFAWDHGFGESAGAAAKHGNSAKDGFGRDEAEGFGPERRGDDSPGVGEPAVDGEAWLPPCEFDGARWSKGVGQGLEPGTEAAVPDDAQARGGMVRDEARKSADKRFNSLLRFKARDADEEGMRGGMMDEAGRVDRYGNR